MQFFAVRREDKVPLLVHLLRNVVGTEKQTVVFVATKHHVEFLAEYLELEGIPCTHSYGSLDQTARKINVAKFRAQKVNVLLVTDVAARGIDIPLLDYVINFDFPPKPKLFVHRVGRVARAGRTGTAFSMVCAHVHLRPDEFSVLWCCIRDRHEECDTTMKVKRVCIYFCAHREPVTHRGPCT